ncbi:ATP-dependent endonuclease [Herbaspirillum seropedicae]|uniref:ATP-dependent nuclease n=1 Tax=Herbaspirillum seropedicae TaxID=964 RepID=UPI00111FAC8A|nr:AAA family ATPase [Herbaspirillum seropedicae]QDD65577.1 ATP-dependent endonuclease [Herbaspirillum seropedicae]
MTIYATESGVAITDVRVSNFRSLTNIEVELGDLTVLIGANNAGKTSFLDALYAAVGAGRKTFSSEDVRLARGEALPPKDRKITVDVRVRPVGEDGKVIEKFPVGSFWTSLWGNLLTIDDEFNEFIGLRVTMAWSIAKADYVVERKALKGWRPFADWLATEVHDRSVTASLLDPLAFHYIDAKRDLDEDLRKQGSFWRRMTDELGLDEADIAELEETLSSINQQIVDKSEVLKHLKDSLADLQVVVAADSAGIDISPVARKLRDLSRGIDVSFSTSGAQAFPLARHGMGTRSLASLLVFRAFASWRNTRVVASGEKIHSLLGLEEPESHLHPQAQRSLFSHIKDISGQRVVSTHSPYFAGQAQLEDLRLFIKNDGETSCTRLDLTKLTKPDDKRKLQETVIESRGDILFARAVILFEGQTEEQALPIWAEAYWGATIHELGFSFIRANGTDYFPFIWLAQSLGIPWYIIGDGETVPVGNLETALKKANVPPIKDSPNVVVFPNGHNFETKLINDGYLAEIELALNEMGGVANYLDEFMKKNEGTPYPRSKGGNRDYYTDGGRLRAAVDALDASKPRHAKPVAKTISGLADESRRFPEEIRSLFEVISHDHGLPIREKK